MHRSRTVVAALTVLAVPLTLVAAAILSPGRPEAGGPAPVQDAWRERAGVPGVVVAVRREGRPLWLRASGTAQRGSGTPLAPDARFRVASITKTFVAVVVLQLVNEGRLALDDAASRYVPGTPGLVGVTIRELLDHTSGIPDYGAVDESFGPRLLRDRDRRWTAPELIAMANTARHAFRPGTGYEYSNTGYLVLGEVIGAITGTSWATQIRERILDPLALKDTYVAGAEPGPAVIAGYHDADNDGDRENVETGGAWPALTSSEGPAGAIVSTAGDLSRFSAALFHGRLLDAASVQTMTAPTPFHPRGSNYGLGLEITRLDSATTTWGHSGFLPGFRSTLWYQPSTNLSVVVLANDSRANTADLAELILRRCLLAGASTNTAFRRRARP